MTINYPRFFSGSSLPRLTILDFSFLIVRPLTSSHLNHFAGLVLKFLSCLSHHLGKDRNTQSHNLFARTHCTSSFLNLDFQDMRMGNLCHKLVCLACKYEVHQVPELYFNDKYKCTHLLEFVKLALLVEDKA